MTFTRAELESFRNATVPDLVGSGLRLLFVGINPSLWTAATGTHFAHPGNRFYPALATAGIIPDLPKFSAGMSSAEQQILIDQGLGITNLVNRATARADELNRQELHQGADRLVQNVKLWGPKVVAIVGITAYRQAFSRPKAVVGRQDEHLGGAELWVLPNPSGLNAHETVTTLAAAYAQPAQAAGIVPS